MRVSSQILLTFLLNAAWQIPLIAGLALLGNRLLRTSSARYSHLLWVGALFLAVLVPLATSSRFVVELLATTGGRVDGNIGMESIPLFSVDGPVSSVATTTTSWWSFQLSWSVALKILVTYFAFVIFRSIKLTRAWLATRTIRRNANELGPNQRVSQAIEKCESAIATDSRVVSVMCSATVPVPVTIGVSQPVIILPPALLEEDNSELITSAIGHEFVHIARRDYILNFLYEVLCVPISFNPATALIRRRIKQTRELFCDELVAERILSPEVYARSLVKLASSAPPQGRLSLTTTVGIADADILEARIMSLLKKTDVNPRAKRLLLIAASLLLIVPCLAAAAFAMRFEVDSATENQEFQEPSQQEKEAREKREVQSRLKEKLMDPRVRAEYEEVATKREMELKFRALRQAALTRLANVTMEQAIQIATSQQPGKVFECSLEGEHWEKPGQLAKDAKVFYHIVVVPEETADGANIHVLVNAIDGTILKTEKDLPRKMRSAQP